MWARLGLTALAMVLAADLAPAADDSAIARLRRDLEFLTSDECEGRGAATQGLFKAADYIAAHFKSLGLKPGGDEGSYFQLFKMQAGKAVPGDANHLILKGPIGQEIALNYDTDFRPLGFSIDRSATAPLVFVGYGITHQESNYNDYDGLDVTGKIVIVLRRTPPLGKDGKAFAGGGQVQNQLGSLANKILNAAQRKAAAILFVSDVESIDKGDVLMPFDNTSFEGPPADLPSGHIKRAVLDHLLRTSAGTDVREIEREINRTTSPRSIEFTGWSAEFSSSIVRRQAEVRNVIGILPGKGPLAGEYVVVGAHYDHLGRGERGSTERDPKKRDLFHRGADDNGSGTVSVMELARRFAGDKSYQGRTLVFMTFAGEEQGLLGSKHFCNNPTVPLDKVAAMLNLDMVGRLRPDKDSQKGKLEIGGVGSAKEFDKMLDKLNVKYDFHLAKTTSAFGPSDHTSFAEKKIPVFFFFTGLHQEYHKPADTIETINFDGMSKIVDLGQDLLVELTSMEKPAYVQTGRQMGPTRGNIPRIGIMPGNYAEGDKGVLVGGVSEGGPAAKAGLKENDLIVEIGGQPVRNMTAYMSVMGLQKKGQAVEVVVERDGKKVTIKVTPE